MGFQQKRNNSAIRPAVQPNFFPPPSPDVYNIPMNKITRATLLQEAIKTSPSAGEALASYHMGCVACSGRMHETVEWAAATHGVVVEELLNRLNAKDTAKE